jgi:dihydroneopterin aldolase
MRSVFPRNNVIKLAGWRYARSCQHCEIANSRVRYAEISLGFDAATEEAKHRKLVEDVATEVVKRLTAVVQQPSSD